jgi:hypothetical protein
LGTGTCGIVCGIDVAGVPGLSGTTGLGGGTLYLWIIRLCWLVIGRCSSELSGSSGLDLMRYGSSWLRYGSLVSWEYSSLDDLVCSEFACCWRSSGIGDGVLDGSALCSARCADDTGGTGGSCRSDGKCSLVLLRK